jgi:hypothetical protein
MVQYVHVHHNTPAEKGRCDSCSLAEAQRDGRWVQSPRFALVRQMARLRPAVKTSAESGVGPQILAHSGAEGRAYERRPSVSLPGVAGEIGGADMQGA